MVLGCFLAGIGLLLVDWQLTATTSVAALAWPLAIAGLGFGIALVTMTAAVLTLVPPEQSGMAASTVNTSRELGGVFGVAVLAAIFAERGSYPAPPTFSGQPFVNGLTVAVWVGTAIVAVGAVVCLFIPGTQREWSPAEQPGETPVTEA
jgi:MFS family permease